MTQEIITIRITHKILHHSQTVRVKLGKKDWTYGYPLPLWDALRKARRLYPAYNATLA